MKGSFILMYFSSKNEIEKKIRENLRNSVHLFWYITPDETFYVAMAAIKECRCIFFSQPSYYLALTPFYWFSFSNLKKNFHSENFD